MDKTGLREAALDQVRNHVAWYPGHAVNRIGAMVEQRPDWCISRQRNWGVPIPSFTCADCGEKVMNDDTLDAVIALFHEKGSDAWFTDAPESYLGEACVCPRVWWPSPQGRPRHPRRVVGLRRVLEGRVRDPRWAPRITRQTSTSRVPTSTAAGSSPRCSPPWAPTAWLPTRPSSRRASPWTARAARCPSRSAT